MSEKHPAEIALDSVCVMKDLSFARSRKEFWFERYSYAAHMLECWKKEEERLNAKNQGLPHAEKPYATIY